VYIIIYCFLFEVQYGINLFKQFELRLLVHTPKSYTSVFFAKVQTVHCSVYLERKKQCCSHKIWFSLTNAFRIYLWTTGEILMFCTKRDLMLFCFYHTTRSQILCLTQVIRTVKNFFYNIWKLIQILKCISDLKLCMWKFDY